MKAILFDHPGGPDVLHLGEAEAPACGDGDLRIEVAATAVNRADLMQRRGLYPPPPGASPILGLEAAGRVIEVGAAARVAGFSVGQRVMALLSGGGYAAEVVVPHGQAMRVPERLSDEEAAAVPEVFLTAFLNLFLLGGLPSPGAAAGPGGEGKSALVHGGASGVGTAALQFLREAGVRALCTVGSDDRAARCRELGAAACWNYRAGDFAPFVLQETGGRGVDLILDCVGGAYLGANLRSLALDGRLVCIGLQGGAEASLDLGLLLRRRLQLIGSTLRALPAERKAALVRRFGEVALPLLASGRVVPVVDRVLPLSEAAAAHRALDDHHVGKVVLSLR